MEIHTVKNGVCHPGGDALVRLARVANGLPEVEPVADPAETTGDAGSDPGEGDARAPEDEEDGSRAEAPSEAGEAQGAASDACLLYTSPSPRDATLSRMPSSA